ncbi:hypothetical protein HK099_004175 [Clydaea vesicula]|uniref:30S ribosomal protein S17, chloroplastic n=1 Tax=Clydaea vesicula TaxID=447962 RepID=A0AAD5XYM4_9FUNG|nr:hypothetical protein HK099_004175 [Clydaea vesicula]KAJ3397253.1 hypothetical protein HDU92_000133 [Lobulomyces angularis]
MNKEVKTVLEKAALKVRQTFTGRVIGTAMQKTIKVRVEKHKLHPIVLKNVVSHKNFLVHDEKEECVIGDIVKINSYRKISKMKNFVVDKILHPANRYFDKETGILYSEPKEIKKDLRYKKKELIKELEVQGKAV